MSSTPLSERRPVMPLRGHVLLPGAILSLQVGRPGSLEAVAAARAAGDRLVLVAQQDPAVEAPSLSDLYTVGTLARVRRAEPAPDGRLQLEVEGLARCELQWESEQLDTWVLVRPLPGGEAVTGDETGLMELMLGHAAEWARHRGQPLAPELAQPSPGERPGALADRLAGALPLQNAERQALLEIGPVEARVHHLLRILSHDVQLQALQTQTQARAREAIEKNQRQHFLREQLKLIQEELGDRDGRTADMEELRRLAAARNLPDEVRRKVHGEIDRLERMPPMAGEVALIRNWLDLVLDLPWHSRSEDVLDLDAAQRLLDEEHFGLDEVKERIIEYLAVCQAQGQVRGPILCLAGPPGVGKTSLARSIARALNRRFVRIALGGIKDEAEIRGNRRVYMGAQPGRFIQGMRSAGTVNPVVLLDEIDKLAADFRGDPAAALLEVLDPEQNTAFRDHYLEIPYDLSDVLFLTTANDLARVPAPLRDRMEVIRVPAYTEAEKAVIAERHVLPRQLADHGIKPGQVQLDPAAIAMLIRDYTREAGVRELDRKIAQVCRKALREVLRRPDVPVLVTPENLAQYLGAPRPPFRLFSEAPEVGTSLAMAVSEAGGSIMPIEAACVAGTGKLLLTGSLGELMRDSAQAAVTWARVHAADLDLDLAAFETLDLHVHIAGGANKNGTSAGVALAVAVLSALSGRPVRHDVAMTGEITLRGRVLPVGGVREKVLAAVREGVGQVLVPEASARELSDLPPAVREAVVVTPVATVWEALEVALLPGLGASASRLVTVSK